MNNATQQIVNKAWNFAHVLRDDGLSYMGYTEQITFLLFLKMADEQTRPPYGRPPIVPPELGWPSLLAKDGDELEVHYRHVLEELGRLKINPLRRADLDEFVQCFGAENRYEREATWSAEKPDGRWRAFDYEELAKRDKLNLDIFWLNDRSLEESENLPDPEVLAQEIADDLQTALDQINAVLGGLKR